MVQGQRMPLPSGALFSHCASKMNFTGRLWQQAGCLMLVCAMVADSANTTLEGVPGAYDLSRYQLCGEVAPRTIGSEASGATFMPPTGMFWVVNGHPPPTLIELMVDWPTVSIKRKLYLPTKDPEAVTWAGQGLLIVSDESDNSFVMVDTNMVNTTAPDYAVTVKKFFINSIQTVVNKGMEGAAYRASDGKLLLAQEQYPRRVLIMDMDTGAWQVLFDIDSGHRRWSNAQRETARKLPSLSELWVTPTGRIFLLSRESKTVVEVDEEGGFIQSMKVAGARPEGLAFDQDGRRMVIASEAPTNAQASTIDVYAVDSRC